MEQSLQVLEWQAVAKADALLRVLRNRFPGALTPGVEEAIQTTNDVAKLDHWLDAAGSAPTLAQFQRLAGLEACNGGRRGKNKPGHSPRRRKS